MFKLLCIVLIAAFSWQLASCRYIGQPSYHGLQPYQALPYSDYGYTYTGPSHYQPSPYQLAPYRSPTYSPPGTYYDHRRGILRPFPGGGVPVLVDYQRRCSNQYVGLKAHPEDRQYYYVCKPDSVVFGKCQNLQVFNATCGQCIQYPRPEYMPNCESEGRFPIYSDCHIYFKCEADLKPRIYSCPKNMVFSPATQRCIEGNQCATTQISNSGSILPEYCEGKFPPCYENGVFRSPADCSLYYTCELQTSGVFLQTRLRCTEGNFYDKQKNQCLPKQQVPCDCIQVAELVYPKPNPLPYQSSVYPAHFDIDSLEENVYPIESDEADDSAGDSSGDQDTAVTPTPTARNANLNAITAEPDVSPNESTDEIQILQDFIDIKNVEMENIIAKTEQPTTESENIESSTSAKAADNETEQENNTTENPSIEDEITTPATERNSTIASPEIINSTIPTVQIVTSTEPDVITTEPAEETTTLQDLEGSGADSENIESTTNSDNEETETTVTTVLNETDDDPTTTEEPIIDETTTVGLEDSSSVSPTIADQITTPAASAAPASIPPQLLSRSLAREEVPPVTDTQSKDFKQTLDKTLSTPIPTQEVPETTTTTTLREDFTRDSKSSTVIETITNTQSPDMDTTTATPETSQVSLAKSDVKEEADLDAETTTQTSIQTSQVPSVGTKQVDDFQAVLATQTPTAITTEASLTDTTIEEDELGVLDSEIFIDDFKQAAQKEDNFEVEKLLPTTAQPTLASTVQEQATSQKTFDETTLATTVQEQEISQKLSDETITAMPEKDKTVDVDDDINNDVLGSEITPTDQSIITPLTTTNPTETTATSTEVTTAATTDNTTDVTLEDDEQAILDSEIFIDDSKLTSSKNKEILDNIQLVADELLPISAKPSEATTVQELQSEETTMMPATNKAMLNEVDDIKAGLGLEGTQTTQKITTITTEASTENFTEGPTEATTESFTDVTLEDDVLGILDSEISISDSQKSLRKDEESFVNNLLAAEEMLPVSSLKTNPDQKQETSLYIAEGTTMIPDNDITIDTKYDDINAVLGSEITQTNQIITTTTQTTPNPTFTTASVTEEPTTATTESSTDVTLEDDVGLLDSEIFIDDSKQASQKDETTFDNNLLLSEELLPVPAKSTLDTEDKEPSQFMITDETTLVPEISGSSDVIDQITTTPQTTFLETLTKDLPALNAIKVEDYLDELGILDSEIIINNEKNISQSSVQTKVDETTTETINISTDTVTSESEFPVTESTLTTTVNDDNLITDEDEHGLLDSELNLQDVRTNQASSVIPSTPDTTENPTQLQTTIDSTETPPTHSTTISITQTPAVEPQCNLSSATLPTSNSLVIKVRKDDTQSSLNSPNKCLHYTLHTKPVINNNNNTNSCNQTVTGPPCDKHNNGDIPRLEIIAERPIDVHFSISHTSCDINHKQNCSQSSNHAVYLKWFPNKSNQTMSLETDSNIKTDGDIDG